jgi:hypothetical protein
MQMHLLYGGCQDGFFQVLARDNQYRNMQMSRAENFDFLEYAGGNRTSCCMELSANAPLGDEFRMRSAREPQSPTVYRAPQTPGPQV